MQSYSTSSLRRSHSLREKRSISQGSIQDQNLDSDDCASIISAPAQSYRRTKSSTIRRRFTLHCDHSSKLSIEAAQNYLTPTQRYEKQIRQLRISLKRVSSELDDKNVEIKMLNELLSRHGISSSCWKLNDIPVINEENVDYVEKVDESPVVKNELCDSGVVTDECGDSFAIIESITLDHEKEIVKLNLKHINEMQEYKETHNNKVENLLSRLSEVNERHCDLRKLYDGVLDKFREQEKQIEQLKQANEEKEKHHHQMYVKMYRKGQDAAKFEHADDFSVIAQEEIDTTSIPDLLQQLRLTEHELDRIKKLYQREVYKNRDKYQSNISLDKNEKECKDHKNNSMNGGDNSTHLKHIESEITLSFLRDVVYHYFTDRDTSCSEGHLRAMVSILGYNEFERRSIEKGVKKKKRIV